jgi:hypothetical protein
VPAVLAPSLEAQRAKSAIGGTDRAEIEALAAEWALTQGDQAPARALLAALAGEGAAAAASAGRRPPRTDALLRRLQGLLAEAEGQDGSTHFAAAWQLGRQGMAEGDPRLLPLRLSQAEALLKRGQVAQAAPLLERLRAYAARLPAAHALRQRIEGLGPRG